MALRSKNREDRLITERVNMDPQVSGITVFGMDPSIVSSLHGALLPVFSFCQSKSRDLVQGLPRIAPHSPRQDESGASESAKNGSRPAQYVQGQLSNGDRLLSEEEAGITAIQFKLLTSIFSRIVLWADGIESERIDATMIQAPHLFKCVTMLLADCGRDVLKFACLISDETKGTALGRQYINPLQSLLEQVDQMAHPGLQTQETSGMTASNTSVSGSFTSDVAILLESLDNSADLLMDLLPSIDHARDIREDHKLESHERVVYDCWDCDTHKITKIELDEHIIHRHADLNDFQKQLFQAAASRVRRFRPNDMYSQTANPVEPPFIMNRSISDGEVECSESKQSDELVQKWVISKTANPKRQPSLNEGLSESRLVDFYAADSAAMESLDIEFREIDPLDPQPNELIRQSTPSRSDPKKHIASMHFSDVDFNEDMVEFLEMEDLETALVQTGGSRARNSIYSTLAWLKGILQRKVPSKSTAKIIREVEDHLPCRGKLPVLVFDFYPDKAERFVTTLGEIEKVMATKPDGVDVRWIHAPLGVGLFHSSVEDIFLKGKGQLGVLNGRRPSEAPRGKSFNRTGRTGWPYLETELLNLRSIAQMQETREIARAFLNDPKAQEKLDLTVFDHNGSNRDLKKDVEKRAKYLKRRPCHWETVKSDLPLQLSDGVFTMKNAAATRQQPSLRLKKQMLQQSPPYRYAYLARDAFRCFNRGDGFLLSLSPSTGLDYCNRDLLAMTKNPCRYLNRWRSPTDPKEDEEDYHFPNKKFSAIAHTFAEFERDGTKRWHHKTAEWVMVYLMTEIACTPHSMRSGYSVPSILEVYDTQVSKLIERKYEPWIREETTKLFHSCLKTIDELTTLGQIYKRKLGFLERLFKDCEEIEVELRMLKKVTPVEEAMTMLGRVNFAMSAVKDSVEQCDQLKTDLTASLNLMFQLRSIEQNDRAISVDAHSRAILILSAVTFIFLPLSFWASFYSMNVQGIAGVPPPHA